MVSPVVLGLPSLQATLGYVGIGGIVIITIHIGRDAVAVGVADVVQGSGRTGAIAVGVSTSLMVVLSPSHGIAGYGSGIRAVVIIIDIGADAVAVGIADAGGSR